MTVFLRLQHVHYNLEVLLKLELLFSKAGVETGTLNF